MLVKLKTLASNYASGSGVFVGGMLASTDYLFNTKNVTDAKVYSTDDTEFRYVFEPEDNNSQPVTFRVTQTVASIKDEAAYDAPAATQTDQWIALDVYEGDDTAGSTTEHHFYQDRITFGEEYTDENITSEARIYVNEGGFTLKSYIVGHTISEIETLAQAT